MSGFQQSVKVRFAPAQEGDFASANPRATMLAGPNSLVAGALGVTVARFAWAISSGSPDVETGETDFYNTASNAGVGLPSGFVHREQQALITVFLGEGSNLVPQGLPVVLHVSGDFWVKNAGAGAVTAGQKVYASFADGTVSTAATATPPTNALITANTATNTTLTVTANTGKPIVVGQPVSGAGIQAGTTIAALGTGTGGAGTYTLSLATTATATGVTVTAQTSVETKWYAMSAAAAGELFKMSSYALG